MFPEIPGGHRYVNRIAPTPLVPVQLDPAAEAQRQLGESAGQVVSVFPDRMERYFTTELFAPFV